MDNGVSHDILRLLAVYVNVILLWRLLVSFRDSLGTVEYVTITVVDEYVGSCLCASKCALTDVGGAVLNYCWYLAAYTAEKQITDVLHALGNVQVTAIMVHHEQHLRNTNCSLSEIKVW